VSKWPTKPLGEVCEVNPRLNRATLPPEITPVTFVPMASICEVRGSINEPEIRNCGDVSKGYRAFSENDVLFAKITPCMQNGKAAIARGLLNGIGFGSTEYHVLRTNEAVTPEWIFHFIRRPAFRDEAEQNFTGTGGQQRVPPKFMERVSIPVPPMEEQERIVGLLDEAEGLRQLRQQADQKTAQLIPALFHQMFGNPATNPKGWETERLIDITSPKQWPTITQKQLLDEGYPVFGANGVIGCFSEFNHTEPTVLITCRGATCGTINVCPSESYVTGNAMALDDPDISRITIEFLEWVLRVRTVDDTITGSAQPQITRQNLKGVTIPIPPLALQTEFANRVAEIREMEAAQAQSRARLDDTFKSLLHRAFNGEL
jgi:restriction endonuclease S subunit